MAEGALEALPRFQRKARTLAFQQGAGALLGCLLEKLELLAVTTAPFAEEQMKPQPEPGRSGEWLVQSQRLKAGGLLAGRQNRSKPPSVVRRF